MNDVAVTEQGAAAEPVTEAKIIEYLDAAGKTNELLPAEKKMFVNIAREFGLNPFKREIHITAYGQGDKRKCSVITGYEVYIKRAERTGKLDGWKASASGEGKSMKAVVEIFRKDWKYPFQHEVRYAECVQVRNDGSPNSVWAKQPSFMLRKVAIGQAFRLCFSDDLGGMPYEEAEMPQEDRNVTEGPPENTPHENTANKINNPAPYGRQALIDEFKEIIEKTGPDGLPYFNGAERGERKNAARAAKSMEGFISVCESLKKEFAKRVAAYKPVPFDDGFKDDYPWKPEDTAVAGVEESLEIF